jgi:cytochrome c5
MKAPRIFVTLGASLGLTAACAATLPVPTNADIRAARARTPNATLDDLATGRTLYVERCSGCHLLIPPERVAPDDWRREIVGMRDEHDVSLTDREIDLLELYLASLSARAR